MVRVNQKLSANLDLIPPGASQPLIKPRSIDDVPILALTLWSKRYGDYELRRLAAPSGRVVISVPIEVGPALLGKQMFRAIAAWRGHGDYQYRETYTPREMIAAALAMPRLARAEYLVDTPNGPLHYCGHKGFDWRILEREIRARFTIQRRLFSPLGPLGAAFNSQVWFVAVPQAGVPINPPGS